MAHVRTADAFAVPRGDFGSVTLVVNSTGVCGHPVPLDAKVATSPSINRHKYNAGKFGPNAPHNGYAEFLGPHQTAEWFGVSPTAGGLRAQLWRLSVKVKGPALLWDW